MNYELLLETESEKGCLEGSVHIINFLVQNYPDLFPVLTLIKGYSGTTETANGVPETRSLATRHIWTACFLAQDRNGMWYAGSPGNHKADSDESLMTRVYASADLDKLIHQIESSMGGYWVPSEAILNAIEKLQHKPKRIKGKKPDECFLNILQFNELAYEYTLMLTGKEHPFSFCQRNFYHIDGPFVNSATNFCP